MDLIGYFASALIGISLGLIGGGGSILTVPVLVYLFKIEPALATAYSLFIVGTTALVGGLRSAFNKTLDLKTAIIFAIPAFISVYLTRRYIMPIIPPKIFTIGNFILTKDIAIMIFFALIMLAAAISMILDKKEEVDEKEHVTEYNYPMIFIEGSVVGVLTGIVGAGGGFLIIPALVLFARLPMKKAVGTSLLIIAAKSLIGFLGDIGSGQSIDYPFILTISGIAIAGIFIGIWLAKYIRGKYLKITFGWFVLFMGTYIIFRETML